MSSASRIRYRILLSCALLLLLMAALWSMPLQAQNGNVHYLQATYRPTLTPVPPPVALLLTINTSSCVLSAVASAEEAAPRATFRPTLTPIPPTADPNAAPQAEPFFLSNAPTYTIGEGCDAVAERLMSDDAFDNPAEPGSIGELTRVTRTRGRLLVVDQVASADPLEALAHNRLERLRDPSHVRVLSDQDFRLLFDANDLVLRRSEVDREDVELDRFLDLAGCAGDDRAAVYAEVERLLASGQTAGISLRRSRGGFALTLAVGWYLLEKVPPPAPTTAT